MKNEDIENLLDITYKIVCEENRDIEQFENKVKKMEEILDIKSDMLFQIEKLNEKMTDSLITKKKEYFVKNIDDFMGISALSPKMRGFLTEKIALDYNNKEKFIKNNKIYEVCCYEFDKVIIKVNEILENEKKEYFDHFLKLQTEIEKTKTNLFFDAMLISGFYLRKIEDFRTNNKF